MTSPAELMNKVNRKTLHLVLLCVATGGLYLLIWLYKTNQHLREATGQTVCSETYIIWICVCMGLSGVFVDNTDEIQTIIAGLLSIASAVLCIVWAFNARSLLMTYANAHQQPYFSMNAFYTFLFNVYYINYCINELGENAVRQQPIYTAQPTQI